ncbi:MAG TPA: hypothetical protein PLD10_07140, partial [Rhodopila sp.]|nr:hypothetical protein [Rhodopila sp.]
MSKQPFPSIQSPVVSPQSGVVTPAWRAFFKTLWDLTQGSGENVVYSEDGLSVPLNANGGAGTEIVNLAPGLEARGSQAAVNGDQLFAVDQIAQKAYTDANLALGIVEGLDFDNLPDGPVNYYKTRSQYVDGGIAFLPKAGLDGLFNPSFELNAITAPGTKCSVVGDQPSDGWRIIQNDVDVNGVPLWNVEATNTNAVNGTYSLAFSLNPGAINTSAGLQIVLESIPIGNSGATLGGDASFFGATVISSSTFPFTYVANLNVYDFGYDPAQPGSSTYAASGFTFGTGTLTPLGSWTTFSSLSNGWSATSVYPLYKARIRVLAEFGAATVTSAQGAQPIIFVDNLINIFQTNLATQVTGTLPGTVAHFQSGSVTITPVVGAQVTTNITLPTAVVTSKSMVSINWDSASATVTAPGSKASLTSTTNL